MPDVATYAFHHREVLALLIKAAGVKDGDWQLQVTFGFSAGNFGPDDKDVNPGAIAVVTQLGITKAAPDSPKSLVMNAREAMAT